MNKLPPNPILRNRVRTSLTIPQGFNGIALGQLCSEKLVSHNINAAVVTVVPFEGKLESISYSRCNNLDMSILCINSDTKTWSDRIDVDSGSTVYFELHLSLDINRPELLDGYKDFEFILGLGYFP